jgi:uncharacterized membrane protein
VLVVYPILPWLAMMLLGWALGRHLAAGGRPERLLLWSGLGALALFALLRGLAGYGDMLLHREDHSLVQWLHVSKYPPSLTFTALELGLMAIGLSLLMRVERAIRRPPAWTLVLGQTALFFYLLHIPLLEWGSASFGLKHRGGLLETYLGAAAALAILFPLCVWYRRFKAAHPDSLARFL